MSDFRDKTTADLMRTRVIVPDLTDKEIITQRDTTITEMMGLLERSIRFIDSFEYMPGTTNYGGCESVILSKEIRAYLNKTK